MTDELSIGDYVLSGGELAAMVITDAIVRLVPGVLGSETSPINDSHATGLLEYPQYTRPPVYRGWAVPEVLLSGNHAQVAKWRRQQAIIRTLERRADILDKASLSLEEKQLSSAEASAISAIEDEGLLNKPLDELQLSVRSRKCLQKLNIRTIGDLVHRTDAELLGVKNFGVTSLNEIKKAIGSIGLSLRSLD